MIDVQFSDLTLGSLVVSQLSKTKWLIVGKFDHKICYVVTSEKSYFRYDWNLMIPGCAFVRSQITPFHVISP